jgi:hypothetical protein
VSDSSVDILNITETNVSKLSGRDTSMIVGNMLKNV